MRILNWKSASIFAFFVISSFGNQTPAAAQSWSNGYARRRTITIDHTKVPNTDQTNFPVLVSGTYPYLATTANGGNVTSPNGYDIIFTPDAAGTSTLAFEREIYNPGTGAATFWVKIPSLSHTTDSVIYMFYSKSSVTSDQSNVTGVWDSNYALVSHLSDSAATSAVADSTSNANNLTNQVNTSNKSVGGKIGNGLTYNGSSDYSSVDNNSSINIQGSSITLEVWANPTNSTAASSERLIVKEVSGNGYPYVNYGLFRASSGSSQITFWISTGGSYTYVSGGSTSAGTWTHAVGVYNGSSMTLYVNGTSVGTAPKSGNIGSSNTPLVLGADTATSMEYFNGVLDEARISNSARSADWIATGYNNENSPSTFYTVGSDASGGPNLTSLSPTSGLLGASVTINGTNFGSTQGSSTITFNGTPATVTNWSATSIVVTVPSGATTGNAIVTVSSISSNGLKFRVTSGYSYFRAITIDHTKVPNTDQTNFPVLVSGTYPYLATTANGGNVTNANGYDIFFSPDIAGSSILDFEQESYSPSTGAINYWVRVPTVSHSTDTIIYIFYGNSSVGTDQSNKTSVWDSSYLGVWHSGEASGNLGDSTSNNNPAVPASLTQGATGKIGNSATYSGSGTHASVGDLPLFNPTSTTVSAWVYATSYGTYNDILSKV